VRWQTKILKDGVVTWHDEEVVNEVGKSQPYGIYKDSIRLIVEDGHRVDPSPVSTKEGTE
jgi:hypothetical protein